MDALVNLVIQILDKISVPDATNGPSESTLLCEVGKLARNVRECTVVVEISTPWE